MARFCRLLCVLAPALFVCSTTSSSSSSSSSSLSLSDENGNIDNHKGDSPAQDSADKAVMAAIVHYLSHSPPGATTPRDHDVLELTPVTKDNAAGRDDVTDDATRSSEAIGQSAARADLMRTAEVGVSSMAYKRQNLGSSVLGGGYKLGKRKLNRESDVHDFSLPSLASFPQTVVGIRPPRDYLPDYVNPYLEGGLDTLLRKRQFGGVLGGGYKMGKRKERGGENLGIDLNEVKRQFGRVLGGGYKVGKKRETTRNGNPYGEDEGGEKRQFGSVLGGGYKVGKRGQLEMDMYNSRKRQFGSVLGGGYKVGKRELLETDAYHSRNDLRTDRVKKRQFGRVLEGGYKIGKRETGDTKGNPNIDAFQSEKSKREFGRVLGGGYKIGKRQQTGLETMARLYPESAEQLPFQSNQNSIPVDKDPSSTAGNLPSEVAPAWDQSSIPVRAFPNESPAEWNQNRMPAEQQPVNWDRDRLFAGQVPADVSLSKTVVVKQSLSLPQTAFPPHDQFLLNFSPSQTLTKDFLQRDAEEDTQQTPAFSSGPPAFPAFSYEGQRVPENRETAEQMDVAQLVYVLLEEAQTLLKLLPESHSFIQEAPFHQSESTTDSFSAPADSSFRDIKRSIKRDPGSLFHKIQDWTERTVFENLQDNKEAKAENEQSDVSDNQEREEDSVSDRFPKNGRGKRSLMKDEISNPRKRWLFHIKFPRVYTLGKGTTIHNLSNLRKRWFFNIKFPRGYKLGKRSTIHNFKTPKIMRDLHFVPYPRYLSEEPINLIGSLTQYVSRLRKLIHQPNSKQKNPFTWKSPYGYMMKRESDSRNNPRQGTLGPVDSFRQANSVDEDLHPWRMATRQALTYHRAPLSAVLAWMLHARRLNLQTQKDFNNNKDRKESQPSAKHRLKKVIPLVISSRFPGGMSWGPKTWDPFGIIGQRKRNSSTKLSQSALQQSAENPAAPSLKMDKRILGRMLGGYRIGKRLDPFLGEENSMKYRFLRLLQSVILNHVKASVQRILRGEANFDSNKTKRIFWTAPDGSKMWNMDPSSRSNIRVKRSAPHHSSSHQNKPKLDSRSLESSVPDKNTQKRFFWRVLGGYKLGKKTSLGDTKVYDSSQMGRKRSDPSDIVKLMQSFKDLFEDTLTTKEFECFLKTLDGYMLSNFKEYLHDNPQSYKESAPVRNMISKRSIWNLMREVLSLANNSTSSSRKRQRRSCNQNHLETKRGKSPNECSNTPAEEDNTPDDQTDSSLHTFWDQVFKNFQQGKCKFGTTFSQKGFKNSHLMDDPARRPGGTPLRHYDLRKHSSVSHLQNDHVARAETLRKNTPKKRFWGKIIGGYKIGKRPLADQPRVNEATSYDRSLKKGLWGEVSAGEHELGKHNFSSHPQTWTKPAPVTVSKPNKTPRAGLHKRFWGKIIGGYNIPGKRPASQRAKRSAEHDPRDVARDLEVQQQGEALVTGHDTGPIRPPAPSATQDNAKPEPGQWGTDIQDLWQQLQQDLPDQPHSSSDPLGKDQTLGESADSNQLPQPGQEPIFWKLLADFLFGPHMEKDPGALLDFLDPSSFSENVDPPDFDVLSYSPQPQAGGASPSESEDRKDVTTSEIASQIQEAA